MAKKKDDGEIKIIVDETDLEELANQAAEALDGVSTAAPTDDVKPGAEAESEPREEPAEEQAQADAEPTRPTYSEAYVKNLEDVLKELEHKLEKTYAAHRQREEEVRRIRERLERDQERRVMQEKARFFEQLLEPLDNFERCIQATGLSGDLEALMEGLDLVQKGFAATFKAVGLEKYGAPGDRFDPGIHEAISVAPVDDPSEHNRVHTVYQSGYRLEDAVIRPARVVVGKKA